MTCCDHNAPRRELERRDLLKLLAGGFGWLAFRGIAGAAMPQNLVTRPQDEGSDPLAPKAPHFPARAKRVIHLCMAGGPSHVDTFDHKPKLREDDGKAMTGRRPGAKVFGSPWKFNRQGTSGLWLSELFPELGKHADELCMVHNMVTDVPAHPQAFLKLHTGSFQFVRPSLGAWTLYGLGTTNRNVPGFITLNAPSIYGGSQNFGSAFLPAYYQGQRIAVQGGGGRGRRPGAGGAAGEPIEDLANDRLSTDQQRKQIDLVQRLNRERRDREHDGAVDGVIQSYELAFRMQAEVPGLLDMAKESKETLALYGVGESATDGFGRQCLLARRFAEAGVRFIEVSQGGWDHHQGIKDRLPQSCASIDKPIAGLLTDLKRRGMLKDTLILWSGEFGRTPYAQGGDGRDHNHRGFTSWMAGGGVKGGYAHGATDEYGYEAIDGKTTVHDLHATMLKALGLDHERLTFNYAGRDFKLADVDGRPVDALLA